jgi:hypothetical protein
MVEAQRRFIAHGSEMKSKIAMLDVALDRESDSRHTAEVEVRGNNRDRQADGQMCR